MFHSLAQASLKLVVLKLCLRNAGITGKPHHTHPLPPLPETWPPRDRGPAPGVTSDSHPIEPPPPGRPPGYLQLIAPAAGGWQMLGHV